MKVKLLTFSTEFSTYDLSYTKITVCITILRLVKLSWPFERQVCIIRSNCDKNKKYNEKGI